MLKKQINELTSKWKNLLSTGYYYVKSWMSAGRSKRTMKIRLVGIYNPETQMIGNLTPITDLRLFKLATEEQRNLMLTSEVLELKTCGEKLKNMKYVELVSFKNGKAKLKIGNKIGEEK